MKRKLSVREIFEEISKCESKKDILTILNEYGKNLRFIEYIRFMFSDEVEPEYIGYDEFGFIAPSEMPIDFEENNLHYLARMLYIFDKKRNSHIKDTFKYKTYKDIIASLSKEDGKFFTSVLKEEATPKNLTIDIVKEAFPQLKINIRRSKKHQKSHK